MVRNQTQVLRWPAGGWGTETETARVIGLYGFLSRSFVIRPSGEEDLQVSNKLTTKQKVESFLDTNFPKEY